MWPGWVPQRAAGRGRQAVYVSGYPALCMTVTRTDKGRHLDHHDLLMLEQATIRRQRHLSRASPAPGGESGSLRAEQGCKRILPLELRW